MRHIKLIKVSPENGGLIQGHYVFGYLDGEPVIGEPVVVERYNTNGRIAAGILTTSPVVQLTGDGFKTQNSTYQIEELPPRAED